MGQVKAGAILRCAVHQALHRGAVAFRAIWRHAPQTRRALGKLARRSEGKNATDRTRYGQTRASPRRFYTHHMQQLSRAAVMYDARALAKQITCLKQELRGRAAQAAPAGVGGA